MRALQSFSFVLVLIAGAGVAAADNTKPKRGRAHQVVPTGADDVAGATVNAAAEAELEAMTSRSSVGLTAVTRADGTTAVDLEGRFMSVAVAGATGTSCHTGSAVAKAAKVHKSKRKARAAKVARPALPVVKTVGGLEVM